MGRQVFGAASLLLGVAYVALRDQLISNWQLPGVAAFIFVSGAAQILGGAFIQFPKTARLGATILGIVYLIFALTLVPEIVAHPAVYASWGDVFYGLALVAGAMLGYALASVRAPYAKSIGNASVILFGLCSASFAVEQVEFLRRTISLVPKWIPPSGMFWAIATTIAFGLAALALLSGYKALLASRLLTLMLLIFSVAVWIPLLIAAPSSHSNWSEGLETFATAGAAWLVADFLLIMSSLA